jgi:hypothetical protein
MQAREGQEAFDAIVSANEDDYLQVKRKGTATRVGGADDRSDADSGDEDGSLSLKQRQWFFPAFVAMAPAPSLSDFGRGVKELPDEVSVMLSREGLQLVAPEDKTAAQPLRSWNWVEIFSYCGSTTEEDNMDIFDFEVFVLLLIYA